MRHPCLAELEDPRRTKDERASPVGFALSSRCLSTRNSRARSGKTIRSQRDYSSPSSSPALDVGAPPNIDGTPAGGAALLRAFLLAAGARFAADRPVFAALGAALLAGFLAAFLAPPAFLEAARFLPPAFFFVAVLPAAFLVVFVFFAPAFFLAAIRMSSCRGDLHDVYGHLRYMSNKKNLTAEQAEKAFRC